MDDDFWAGGRLARAIGALAAMFGAMVVCGVVGLFASLPVSALSNPDPSDYGAILYPLYGTVMGAVAGGLGMALFFLRRKRR